jgi:salicylate biosynthesis isochorismate synthase
MEARRIEEASRSSESLEQLAEIRVVFRELAPFEPRYALWATADFALFDPGSGRTCFAFGSRASFEFHGEERFDRLRLICSSLRERLSSPIDTPYAFAGFSFSPAESGSIWRGWPAARLVVPRVLLWTSADSAGAAVVRGSEREIDRLCSLVDRDRPSPRGTPEITPRPNARFREIVNSAELAIRERRLEKVVLARSRRTDAREGEIFDPAGTALALRAREPNAFTFLVRNQGASLVGATPELLARLRGRTLEASAIAGTVKRSAGEEDHELKSALLASKKDRNEHQIVVASIRESLKAATERLDPLASPEILELSSVQHLVTKISGLVRPEEDLISIASRLHPTPAVGGAPRSRALGFIKEHEGLDRGWYSGAIGYLEGDGGGVLAVPLRCALIERRHATAFAGAGIVLGSDPDREHHETELKLQAIERALVTIEEAA